MTETVLSPLEIETGALVYEDRNQKVYRVTARFDGFTKEYFVSDHGQRVALLAVKKGKVLLVRQYRLLVNGLSYEVPGGKLDEGETPESAAVRECLEETGIRCLDVKPLISYHPSLDIWKNYTRVFWSNKSEEVAGYNDGRMEWLPLARCLDMIRSGQICDSLSIIALLTYHSFGKRLKQSNMLAREQSYAMKTLSHRQGRP